MTAHPSSTAADRHASRRPDAETTWRLPPPLRPLLLLPLVSLLVAAATLVFSRIEAPPTTMLELLVDLLPEARRIEQAPSQWPLFVGLAHIDNWRLASASGGPLLLALLLQTVACAAIFALGALRWNASAGLVAALALGCNPAWLVLLARGPGIAAWIVLMLAVLGLILAIRERSGRSTLRLAATGAGVAMLALVMPWRDTGLVDPLNLSLAAGALALPVGAVLLMHWDEQQVPVRAGAAVVLALGLLAPMAAIATAPAWVSQSRAAQAQIDTRRAFQDIVRPFVRRAEKIVIWDQTSRQASQGPVSLLPRRFDISTYELNFTLRYENLRLLLVITCRQLIECDESRRVLDEMNMTTESLITGGVLPQPDGALNYTVLEWLPVIRPAL